LATKLQPATTFRAVLGKVFEAQRISTKKNQQEFADAIGTSQSAWSRVETGQSSLSVEEFVIVCKALRLSPIDALNRVRRSVDYLQGRGVQVVMRPGKERKDGQNASAAWLGATALGALIFAIVAAEKK
jgi:transcriptional regulator with XRE-family HTH domain